MFEKRVLFGFLPDRIYLEKIYERRMKKKLDLSSPKSFNEKLQWLKLYDRKDIYTIMVDKYEAKKYVASLIGEDHIIPTYGVWEKFEDIDFDRLPDRYVLKCTHDSGGIVIVRDGRHVETEAVREKIQKSLHKDFYKLGREWPYKNVKPRIIAEKYLEDHSDDAGKPSEGKQSELTDYKIHCFSGEPKVVLVCKDRFSASGMTEDFFDTDWNHLNVKREKHDNSSSPIARPPELDEMFSLARVLSKNIPFLRVDFYVVDGKIYFGELTFYPTSGFGRFIPDEFDQTMGEWISLPKKR